MTVPASFREMPRWWHDHLGTAWLDELPGMVEAQCTAWNLVIDGQPLHGSNALVVPVTRHGHPLMLRLCPPGDDVAQEAKALRLWDGRGAVQLFDADEDARAMLLERLDSTHTLAAVPIQAALPVFAELINVLAVPVPADIRSTATAAGREAEQFERDWLATGKPVPRSRLDAAVAVAVQRASEPVQNRAVNGDLHYEQVLRSDRAPWLVVDPVLLRGDAEYDLGRILWSRLDELPHEADVVAAFDTFVTLAGVPADRARAWVIIRSMSYLLWGLARGLTFDPPRCQRLLNLFC